jgi:hypothetical protein
MVVEVIRAKRKITRKRERKSHSRNGLHGGSKGFFVVIEKTGRSISAHQGLRRRLLQGDANPSNQQ